MSMHAAIAIGLGVYAACVVVAVIIVGSCCVAAGRDDAWMASRRERELRRRPF